MSAKTLAGFQSGIDRTRPRASAKKGTFWKLTNCRVTPGGTILIRPGFRHVARLDSATKGLFANEGALRTFYSAGSLTPPSAEVNIAYHALRVPHGTGPAPGLVKVYSDHLFLGKQYVAVDFDDGVIRHYWLQDPAAWKADTVYDVNELVQPSTPNGYYYRASADNPPDAWQPDTVYQAGESVQPTTYNGFKYTAQGTGTLMSGSTEPDWVASDGAKVVETVSGTGSGSNVPAPPTTPNDERYDNLPGRNP